MSKKEANPLQLRTPVARLNFPALVTPDRVDKDDLTEDPMYRATLIFGPDDNIDALKRVEAVARKDKWGDKMPKKYKTPFKDNDDVDRDAYEAGGVFLRCATKYKPKCVDTKRRAVEDPDADLYPGCYVVAIVTAHAWEHKTGGAGVSFYLDAVQKVRDGEPLSGGGVDTDTAFEVLEDELDGELGDL